MTSNLHPQWCSPFACATTDTDTQHESHSDVYLTRDFELEVALIQTQNITEDEPGDVELRLDVIRTDSGSGYLTLDELDYWITRLSTYREMARYLTTPIVRRAVAS